MPTFSITWCNSPVKFTQCSTQDIRVLVSSIYISYLVFAAQPKGGSNCHLTLKFDQSNDWNAGAKKCPVGRNGLFGEWEPGVGLGWVFKDCFSWASDPQRHENRFGGFPATRDNLTKPTWSRFLRRFRSGLTPSLGPTESVLRIVTWRCWAAPAHRATGGCWAEPGATLKIFYFDKVFLVFSIMKNDIFCIFYQVNLTGSGFLNRTGAEIGY